MTTEERINALELEVRTLRRNLEIETALRASLAHSVSSLRVRFDRLSIQVESSQQRGGWTGRVDVRNAPTVPTARARR